MCLPRPGDRDGKDIQVRLPQQVEDGKPVISCHVCINDHRLGIRVHGQGSIRHQCWDEGWDTATCECKDEKGGKQEEPSDHE